MHYLPKLGCLTNLPYRPPPTLTKGEGFPRPRAGARTFLRFFALAASANAKNRVYLRPFLLQDTQGVRGWGVEGLMKKQDTGFTRKCG
jgi:hypothetical protein